MLFQSTLPRRERHGRRNDTHGSNTSFNPRSREGSDFTDIKSATDEELFQSTLPRRERRWHGKTRWRGISFNPRSREGSDGISSGESSGMFMFQSTLPRRERRSSHLADCKWFHCFNPRSREGSDKNEIEEVEDFIVSIHAPAKGATGR